MPTVFVSYSHRDEDWKDRLVTHLRVLEPATSLNVWNDREMEGGADWCVEIQRAIENADVAVLLVSANFLTSKFISEEEVPRLLERRHEEGVPVLPVIVRSCTWDRVEWLREMLALPRDGKPLAGFKGNQRDEQLAAIAREVEHLVTRSRDEHSGGKHRIDEESRDDLLSRLETVCRLQQPTAVVQRVPGQGLLGDYLRVCHCDDAGISEIYPLAATHHEVSSEVVAAFIKEIDAPYRRTDSGLKSILVCGGSPPPENLQQEAARKRVRLVSFVEYQGLIDFHSHVDKQTAKLASDPIYPPSLYVPQRLHFSEGQVHKASKDALAQVRDWLASAHGRFIVVLGDSGTGKTFLLHELARRMGEDRDGLTPILLQMRSLEKGRSLNALLAQHFAQEGMEGFSPAKFRYMLEQGRIALLFDGFDELALRVTYARAAEHFDTLLQASNGAAKVVVTSRCQHFISDRQLKTALSAKVEGMAGHRIGILQPFKRDQMPRFLVGFCQGDEARAARRLALIDRVRDLAGLSENPRLLSFIAELPEEELSEAGKGGKEITAAMIYELLLDRWLVGEFDRFHPKGAPPGLSVEARWRAVTLLAVKLWQKTEPFVNLSELEAEASRVVEAVGPAAPGADVAAFQVGSGTLLVRDEEGNFSFLHLSILEWLVARSAAQDLKSGTEPQALTIRDISPLMADFFSSLAGRENAVAWARNVLGREAGSAFKKSALLVLDRLGERVGALANLAGQDLRGRDLSGQDLIGADLTGSDLTSARMVESRLDSARLVRARLARADLTRATLRNADLSEADLVACNS